MKRKKNKTSFTFDDYVKVNKSLNRLEELEKNGGRWKAIDRPHKNKKKYDRKRDRHTPIDDPFLQQTNK